MSTDPSNNNRDYADKDVRLVPLVAFLILSLAVTGLTILGVRFLLGKMVRTAEKADTSLTVHASERQLPTGILLQVTPSQDLAAHRAKEAALLHTYGWVDQGAGIARIPIDHAIELVAERGLPTARTEPPPTEANTEPASSSEHTTH